MPAFQDLTGKRFNRLVVLERDYDYPIKKQLKSKTPYWKCQCDCGNITVVSRIALVAGRIKSCGCLKKEQDAKLGEKNLKDLTGKVFGNLTVLDRDFDYPKKQNLSNKSAYWRCRCSCGNITTAQGSSLLKGTTASCGCSPRKYQLLNKTFGYLTVIDEAPKREKDKHAFWKCQCVCGNISEVASSALISGRITSCGCKNSLGELNITQLLKANNIQFETQKTYKDLVNPETGSCLKFDFYLPDYHRLIEFDGEQHYKAIKYWGDEEGLVRRQKLDNIKNDYVKNNNIPLVRIPYWERNNITLDMILGEQYLI